MRRAAGKRARPARAATMRLGAWSAPELDYLRHALGRRPLAAIAHRLRRSEQSVRARAKELFGGRRRHDAWSAVEDAELRLGFGAVPQAQLALALGRSIAGVRARAEVLRAQGAAQPWTAADDATLRRVYGNRDAAALEVCMGRPARDIEAAARRLCLRKDRRSAAAASRAIRVPRWTPADVARLRQMYGTHDNLAVATLLDRSVQSVANKANQLGLRKRKRWLRESGRLSASRRWCGR